MEDIINNISTNTNLTLTFSIKDDYSILKDPIANPYGIGHLETSIENKESKNEKNTFYRFSVDLGFVTVNYFYNISHEIGLGSNWNANNRYIYFGTEHSSFEKIHKKLNCNYGNIDNLVDNLVLNLRKLDIEKTI